MSTAVSLVVGADGSSLKNGSSKGVSSQADRESFVARRKSFDGIIIGGNTARTEPYAITPVPLIVISRSQVNPLPTNSKAQLWNMPASQAVERAKKEFGPKILIEGGVAIIQELLSANLIDTFYLTVTDVIGGEKLVDWPEILNSFATIDKREVDGTLFFEASN